MKQKGTKEEEEEANSNITVLGGCEALDGTLFVCWFGSVWKFSPPCRYQ